MLFCRTLTLPQRKEVDRLLKLLILAANDAGHVGKGLVGVAPGSFSRTFPWLELDDDRKSTLPMGKVGVERSEVVEEGGDSCSEMWGSTCRAELLRLKSLESRAGTQNQMPEP